MSYIKLNNHNQSFIFNEISFPHPISELTVVESQISWIIKTGKYCYKIKKSVLIPEVLDYKTIKKRQKHLSMELRRNKLFAPQIYHHIVSLYKKNGITLIDSEIKDNSEWALLMHQFNDHNILTNKSLYKKLSLTLWRKMIKKLIYCYKNKPFPLKNLDYFLWRYMLHLKEGAKIHCLIENIKNEFIN